MDENIIEEASNGIAEGVDRVGDFLNSFFVNGPLSFLVTLVFTLLLFFAARIFINKLRSRQLRRNVRSVTYLYSLCSALLYFFAAIALLSQITPLRAISSGLLASSGIAAVVLGFAAQEGVSNLISGLFIAIFKPFIIGDTVTINDTTGYVESITLRHTVIRTLMNNRIVIPNSVINSSILENLSISDKSNCNYLDIGIAYDADIDLAKRIITEEAVAHPNVIEWRTDEQISEGFPQIRILCTGLGDFSVDLRAQIWTKDYITGVYTLSDLRQSIKKRFDAEGVEIPYPYRTVILRGGKSGDKDGGQGDKSDINNVNTEAKAK